MLHLSSLKCNECKLILDKLEYNVLLFVCYLEVIIDRDAERVEQKVRSVSLGLAMEGPELAESRDI